MTEKATIESAHVRVTFAASLQRHIPCPSQSVAVASLREVLKTALLAAPDLSHYVFDDQGNIRKHVAVFINRDMLQNRADLSQILKPGDQVLVVQALTGG
jgi:molybdopterin synthase sulfur carrier subunit